MMANDRDNSPRDERFRGEDRYRGDPGSHRGRDDDGGGRGFFERAGDEISSWFGDEEAERRRAQDDRSGGASRSQQGSDHGSFFGGDRDRQRGFGGHNDREQAHDRDPQRGGWFGSNDRDENRYARPQQSGGQRSDHDRGRRDYGGQGSPRSSNEEYRPFAGDYGRGSGERFWSEQRGSGSGSMMNSGVRSASSKGHDPHYQEWRQRQIDQLDTDYDEYRREHQSKFDNDFSGWRSQRQTKRQTLGQVREHMEVVGSDEQLVGKVDKVRGDTIILTRDSQGGVHKSFGCSAIDRIEGDRLILAQPADEARLSLREERNFNERNASDQRDFKPRDRQAQSQEFSDGPHMLERSFSGTYPDEPNR